MALSLAEFCYQALIRADARLLMQACNQAAQGGRRKTYLLSSYLPTQVVSEICRRLVVANKLTSHILLSLENICPEVNEDESIDGEFWRHVFQRFVLFAS
jgi:hypothetical protein